jgi:hypothetical protein
MRSSDQEIQIVVRDGTARLETRPCRVLLLPNGATGALWRGLVYPVGKDSGIDIAGDAFAPGLCRPPPGGGAESAGFAVIEGAEEAYLLLSGPVAVRETAAARLRAAGLSVLRTGRYLGDPVDGIAADWFVRLEIPPGGEPVAPLVSQILGVPPASPDRTPGADSVVRGRLLRDELAAARAEAAGLRAELTRARMTADRGTEASNESESLRDEAARERRLREAAEAARAAAEAALEDARPAPVPSSRPPSSRMRLQDEIAAVVETLLSNLNLIRDSLTVAAVEYSSRRALYRALAELAGAVGRLPPQWKAVQGAAAWWERHVSDGQDNTGRLYARFVSSSQRWDVLISDKAEQTRDIAWLRRNPDG